MTRPEPLDQPVDPSLDDPREEEVRRLLADARHGDPVPIDVATRLDRVLAQLAADGVREDDRVVSDLAVRRRRRVTGLLAAAAAVAVVGIGLGQVLPGLGGSDSADSTAAGGTTTADQAEGGAAERSTAGAAAPHGVEEQGALDLTTVTAPQRVRADRFAADALRARDRIDSRPASSFAAGSSDGPGTDEGGASAPQPQDAQEFFDCEPAAWGTGVVVPVLYDGQPHVLAFRSPAGDSQVVDLLECGTGEILRSTTLPAG